MYRYELRGLPVRPPATGAPGCMYIRCIGAGRGRDASRGASGRARACSGECACGFTGSFETRTSAAHFKEGGCIRQRLMFALHFGTCCVWAQGGGGVTFFFLTCRAFQFCLLEVTCRFCFVSHYLFCLFCFLGGGYPPSWSVSHALCSSVRSEMAGTREKLICVISFSGRYGSERPCSPFVLFDFANLCSLKQNSQTGSILDQ